MQLHMKAELTFKYFWFQNITNLQMDVAANVCVIVQCDERGAFR